MKNAPSYDAASPPDRRQEIEIFEYCGRPGYWARLLPIAGLTMLVPIASAPSFALTKAQIDARGLTLGVARHSEVMLFMTQDALDRVGS